MSSKIKTENIIPLTDLQRSSSKIISKVKTTGAPMIVTQHGRPVAAIINCELFEKFCSTEEMSQANINDIKNSLNNELNRVTSIIIEKYDPKLIFLFGSLASNNISQDSDIDLIVVKNTDKKFWFRQKEIAKIVKPHLACDIIVYTPAEWETALKKEGGFVVNAFKKGGKIIYEKAA